MYVQGRLRPSGLVPGLLVALCFCIAAANESLPSKRKLLGSSDHKYKVGDEVMLYANKVGPFQNPSETYQYYTLPFCKPKELQYKLEDLGEVLEGDRLVSSLFKIKFREDIENQELCTQVLAEAELKKFRKAVKQDYYFQMYYDDLPVWGFIGRVEAIHDRAGTKPKHKYFLFTHFHFELAWNKDNIIEINVSSDATKTVDISEGKDRKITFSYSAKWKETKVTYDHRMDRYAKYSFLPQHLEIHWFSIINSCVTVLLLTGFLATILLRVLKNDFLKYTRDDEMGEEQEETGWKYIHGDVFRFPQNVNLFCGMLGVGTQMFCIAFIVFLLSLMNTFYPYNRGGLLSACVILYALTAGIAGYVSGSNYRMMGGTTKLPREVPPLPWYRSTIPQMLMAGFLPFSAIYIELYYIFASVWGHKLYTIYSILFIVFIILIIVTAFITVALTYFQLAVEDHRWWWRSFMCGGSTGLFIFGYCFYYYFGRSEMTGLMQSSIYFGYNSLVCFAFFLMLGSIGFRASLLFVRHIYRAIKCE